MSDAKHTPGPWHVENGDGIWVSSPDDKAPVICDVLGRVWNHSTETHVTTPEDEANARLIAAAPDLLAMLKEVKKFVAVCCANKITRSPEGIRQASDAFGRLEQLIAKAEG